LKQCTAPVAQLYIAAQRRRWMRTFWDTSAGDDEDDASVVRVGFPPGHISHILKSHDEPAVDDQYLLMACISYVQFSWAERGSAEKAKSGEGERAES
jgi:hypothetical protein